MPGRKPNLAGTRLRTAFFAVRFAQSKLMKVKLVTLGACMSQLAKFVEDHSPTVTVKGYAPASFITPLQTGGKRVVRLQGTLDDMKSGAKDAAQAARRGGAEEYATFSNALTMLIGIFGRGTPVAQQLTSLRKVITDQNRARGKRPRRQAGRKPAAA